MLFTEEVIDSLAKTIYAFPGEMDSRKLDLVVDRVRASFMQFVGCEANMELLDKMHKVVEKAVDAAFKEMDL